MQKNEPTFVKEYKSKENNSIVRDRFRDIVSYNFGLSHDITISV